MGVDLGLIKEINDSQIAKMYFYINPANLQLHFGQNLDSYDRDIKRAEIIKQLILEKWLILHYDSKLTNIILMVFERSELYDL